MSPGISYFNIEIRDFYRLGRATPNGGWLAEAKIEADLENVIFYFFRKSQISMFEFRGFFDSGERRLVVPG